MDYSVQPEISSSQERASKAFKGKVRSPNKNQSQIFWDTQRAGIEFGRPYVEWNRELRDDADDVPGVHQKYRGRHHKQESVDDMKKDDELVKHMSGLPNYLQKMERGDDKQGKALNFGVLDWKRLEKWNNNEGLVPSKCYTTASSSDCNSSFMVSGSSTISRKQLPGRKGHQSHGKVAKLRGFETAPWSNVDRKRNLHLKDKSSGEFFSEFSLDREKRKESDNGYKSAKEHPLVARSNYVLPTSSHVTEKCDQDFEINTAINKEVDIPRKSIEHENIVLLLPKCSPNKHGSKSAQLPPSRTAVDENLSEAHSNLGCFSPEQELHYLDLYSKIPHSCPLSCNVADTVESDMEKCISANVKLQLNKSGLHQRPKEEPIVPVHSKCLELNSLRLDPSTKIPLRLDQGISVKPVIPDKHVSCSRKSMARYPIFKESSSVPQSKVSYSTIQYGPVGLGTFAGSDEVSQHSISDNDRATTSTPKRQDQHISEQPDTMNRHPSPSPQFTFSRMTRSLSFKDGTSLPPLSSSSAKVKSGPLSSEGFCDFDNFDRHHVSAGYRPPLSPLSKSEIPTRSDKGPFDQPGTIGRHPSPSRFSFRRISRSFSFKEVPTIPQSGSSCATNSRPVRSEPPDGLGELNQDNLFVGNSARFSPSTTADKPKRLDPNIGKQPDAAGRHPSPSRRFSFSNYRRISKSLDFKEISSGPQLSSRTTFQPAGLNSSTDWDKFNQDNVSASNRARSSPLRRLLDPLLKPRAVVNSADTVKTSKENLTSVSPNPITANELLQSQRQKTPNVQALLQLTKKNGLPLFRLVVDSSSDILAAAVKQLPTPGDDASSLIYALYSVHEVKNKNGGWMSKGSKGKQSNLGYNTIGQMRIFNSCPPGYCGEKMKDQYVSRESILYGVEIEQGNTPEFMLSKELAAIAIKNAYQNDKQGNKDYMGSREGFTEQFLENTCNQRENENPDSTTVILGGVHGLPDKVIPSSSLIWRYGGSCDCGGWDVGCKLRILTTQDQKRNSKPSISCSTGLDLFFEGGEQEKKPSFSLAPFKTGVYSVEFDASISLLQSFFISIAFLSSQRLHEIFDGVLDTKNFTEPKIDKLKFPTMVLADIPAKYVTKPPPSPVGRV